MQPGIIACFMVFSIPLLAIWSSHKRKMLELQLRGRGTEDNGLREDMEALRQEVRTLRDTSMQYDLSFDTALQRMEHRVEGIVRRAQATAQTDDVLRVGNGR